MKNMKLLNLLESFNEKEIDEGTLNTIVKTAPDAKSLKTVNPALHGAFNDVIQYAKSEGNEIKGFTKKNPSSRVSITNIDDLISSIKAGGLDAKAMAQMNKGLLKSVNTPREMVSEIVRDMVADKAFIKKYGSYTPAQLEKLLKDRKYSQASIEEIVAQTKKSKDWKTSRATGAAERKAKKTQSGKDKQLTTKTNGSGTPPAQSKTMKERFKELLDGVKNRKWTWKQALAWGAGLGIGAYAIWWALFNGSDVVPEDMPVVEPPVDNQWAPCIQELIKSGEGVVAPSESGEISVTVKTDEYPKGLQFYPNGRVMDAATNKKGTWKCKDAMPVIAESQKISLIGLLNEQGGEIDINTMESYVDTAVDDLDGFVDGDNLNSLLSILNSLKGKTFQGKDAMKEFLSLYKEDEGGDDFIADVNSVGVKTLGTKAIVAKRQILSLVQGGGGEASTTTPGAKTGLSKIDITWDGEKKTGGGGGEGGNPVVKKKSVNYRDCSNKDFPYEFGCIAPKISEIQACLGVTPQKGYFGPKTLAALKAKGFIDSSNTITKETYDKVAAICGGQEKKQDGEVKKRNLDTEPIKTIGPKQIQPVKISGDLTKLPTIQPTDAMNGQKIYEALSANYGDGTNPEYPYIFQEGGRIKYKGEGLPQETLNALNTFISSMDYYYMKGKPKEDYGYKYVWVKK
jgi:hypothetical protein